MQNHQNEHEVAGEVGQTYSDLFPALENNGPARAAPAAWAAPIVRPATTVRAAVPSNNYSESVVVSYEERRLKDMGFGGKGGSERSVCAEIGRETGAQITLTEGKDRSLTLLISGKRDDVKRARNLALQRLQTQANIALPIPKEYHRFILGAKGKTKEDIETSTATKITVPNRDDESDAIKITGPAEGINIARERILQIYEEQSKKAAERMEFPKKYHPFIFGPYNQTLEKLKSTGVQVNVPPPSVQKDEISIAGEKNAVAAVKRELLNILAGAQKTKEITVDIPRAQHRYVQGPRSNNLYDILEKTGVWVELPAADSDSNSVTLRGDPTRLGNALNMVWTKANSVMKAEVKAPSFIHKYMIGKGGEKVRELGNKYPEVQVSYSTEENKIVVEGPPNDVDAVKKQLEAEAKELVNTMAVQELTVDEKYMKHIVGKSGSNVSRLKTELGVQIRAGDREGARPNVITVEGPKQGVADAVKQLKEQIAKMENEKSKDIIIDRKLHKLIIGNRGEKIREIRELFKETNVAFPDPEENSDVVTIRGPKEEVDKCFKHLEKLVKELVLSSYAIELPIFKDMHRYIIGKEGATIRKIRETTNTKIDLPEQESDSDVIVITGKKENVEEAKKMIEKIQNELANAVELKINVPNKLHNHIIGAKGQQIRAIIQECGNVQINFPPSGSTSDEITIRGPKEDAEKALNLLQKLAHDKELSGHIVEIVAKPEYHRYIKNSSNKLREKYNVRISFPGPTQDVQDRISVIGKKEDVEKAQAHIDSIITDLQNTVEDTVTIPVRYHKRFTAKRAEVINEIQNRTGAARIAFPREPDNETVSLRGSRDAVDEAKRQLLQRVTDWDSYVTVDVEIPPKAFGQVMGRGGNNVDQISKQYNVHIKFPERNKEQNGRGAPRVNGHTNGHSEEQTENRTESPEVRQTVTVTGTPADCEAAKEALLALVPISVDMSVPIQYHRGLVGLAGENINKLAKKYDVNISVPHSSKNSDIVTLYGLKEAVEEAKNAIHEEVKELELRSFKGDIRVDPKHHSLLIGPKGSKIAEFRKQFNVDLQLPRRVMPRADGSEKSEEELAAEQVDRDLIVVIGYESDVEKAKAHIQAMIDEINSKVELEVPLDARVHARIIGGKGMGLRNLCTKYKVDIRFPRRNDPNEDPNKVVVVGDEDKVYEMETELKRLEDVYMEDVIESEAMQRYHNPRPVHGGQVNGNGSAKEFVVKGAPWQQGQQQAPPQLGTEEFPNLAGMSNGSAKPVGESRWGAPR